MKVLLGKDELEREASFKVFAAACLQFVRIRPDGRLDERLTHCSCSKAILGLWSSTEFP